MKKNLQAAAAGQLAEMQQSAAQRIAQQAAAPAPIPAQEQATTKNDKPFTIWTTPENVRRWKAYQKAKKATLPTQAALFEAAILEYMEAHPVTDVERAELLKSLDL